MVRESVAPVEDFRTAAGRLDGLGRMMPGHRPLWSGERLREPHKRCSRLGPEGEHPCLVRSNVSMNAAA